MRSYTGIGAALSLLSFATPGSAFFRVPCPGRIVTERADPIVSPGSVAGHVHSISGGNGFGFTESYEQARTSTCSSCPIKQDLSNYWTPALYYQYENGSFESVPQSGDGVGVYGGMTVYWLQRGGPNNDNLTAYPEGFRMLAGDPFKRAPTDDFAGDAVSFVCLDYSGTSGYFNHLPNTTCPDGMRAQVFFPSCWDGVNLDSSDHKSHMAYPTEYSYDNGPCPASHPVHMISLFYEVIWSTAGFEWWNGTTQPFVFSMGDPLGYGFHGDFINGWDVEVLQNATDNCLAESGLPSDCDVFEFFTTAESEACIIAPEVDEQVTGLLDALPGCNPVTWGPDEAPTHYADCPVTNISAAKTYYTNVTDWVYLGCGSDNETNRTFNGTTYSSSSMTVESCLSYCKSRGYHYAGLEYGDQCFCGNDLPENAAPVEGVLGNCITLCDGNSTEYCGGGLRLSMYYTDTVANVTSCPAGNSTTYTSPYNNENFFVECGFNYGGTNLGSVLYPGNGIQGCIDACANTTGCVAVSLSGTACYLKSNIGTLKSSTSVDAARLIIAGSSSSISSSTSATSSASGSSTKTASLASSSTSGTSSASGSSSKTSSTVSAASSSSVTLCPNLNATTYTDPTTGSEFFIECGIDHSGGDLSMTYVKNLAGCISACASTTGCVDVSLSGTACYMKSSVGAAVSNGVAGARLLAASSSSVLSSATSATSSSKISSAFSSTSASSSSETSSASSVVSSTAFTASFSKTSSTSSVSSSTASTASSSKTSSASSVSSATSTSSSSKVSSSSSFASSTTSTTASAAVQNKAAATTTVIPLCPNKNSTIYTEPITGHNFTIECGIDHSGGDLKMVYTANLTACIGACANTTGCVDVSLSGTACYMKSSVGSAVYNGVKGARLMTSTSASSSSAYASVTAQQNVASASSKTSSTSTSSKATSTSLSSSSSKSTSASSSSTLAASTSSKTSTIAKRAAVTNI